MMPSTGVMAMTTTATGCVWSFPGVAGAPEAALVGSEVLQEADMDLHPDAQSTGSLCQVSIPGGGTKKKRTLFGGFILKRWG